MPILYDAIYIEVTSDCMLSCPYCYHGSRRGTGTYFPLERYRFLLNELPAGVTVDLSGGEPLLHPDIRTMICLTAEKGYRIRLITNGILLADFPEEELSLLDTVAISLDGTTQEEHDAIRGKGSFQKTERGLAKLRDAGLSDRVTFDVTVSHRNVDHLEDFLQYALSWGAGSVNFGNLHSVPEGENPFIERESLSTGEALALYEQTTAFREAYRERLLVVPTRNIGGGCPLITPGSHWGLRIDAEMNVYPCEGFCGTGFSLGNLSNRSMDEVLEGSRCQEIADFLLTRIEKIEECRRCVLKGIFCLGGCAADAYFRKTDCLCTDGACNVRRRQAYRQLLTVKS